MNQKGKRVLASVCAAALVTILVPAEASAKTRDHECGAAGKTLQSAIDAMEPGDTLLVRGTCSESVTVHAGMRDITIDGGGTARIDRVGNTTSSLITVRGKGVTIRGLRVAGGRYGFNFTGGGTGTVDACNVSGANSHGITIVNNSWARVINSTIEGNGSHGICVCEHASAEIGFSGDFAAQASPNTIRNNASNGITVVDSSFAEVQGNIIQGNTGNGIAVNDNSSARIGAQTGTAGSLQSGNTIEANTGAGIALSRSANARIVGNRIVNNSSPTPEGGTNQSHGISLIRAAQADIANNEISGNTGHGILVWQNSTANLDSPANRTSTANPNGRQGVYCGLNSFAGGSLGTIRGSNLSSQFFAETGCITSF